MEFEKSLVAPKLLEGDELFAQAAMNRVFYSRFEPEAAKIEDEGERNLFLNKKAAVFVDAIRRGVPLLDERLHKAGFSFDTKEKTAKKSYSYDTTGVLRWRIHPKSEDPFEIIDFNKAVKEAEIATAGETDILTDPELVYEAFETGAKEQDQLFISFLEASNLISELQKPAQHIPDTGEHRKFLSGTLRRNRNFERVMRHVKSTASAIFNPITQTRQLINRQSPADLKEEFINQYVVIDDPILYRLPEAINAVYSVMGLADLFQKNGKPLNDSPDERLQLENSLVINLLTNPDSIKALKDLREPVTRVENVVKLYSLISGLKANNPSTEYLETLHILIQQTIVKSADQLSELFTKLNITPAIGLEFLQSLMLDKLKTLPGSEYVLPSPQSQLNRVYKLIDPLPYNESQAGSIARSQELMKNFIDDVLTGKPFQTASFIQFYPEQQKTILSRILEGVVSKQPTTTYETIIDQIISSLGIAYRSFDSFTFEKASSRKSGSGWIDQARTVLLEFCLDRINQQDTRLMAILEEKPVSYAVNQILKKINPGDSKAYIKRANFSGLNRDKAVVFARINCASYALIRRYNPDIKNRISMDTAIDQILLAATTDFNESKWSRDYQAELPDMKQFRLEVKQEAQDILDQAKAQFFPSDYGDNRQKYLSQALSKALKQLS